MNFVEQVITFSETMEIKSYRAQKRGAGYLFKNLIPLVWKFDKLFLGKVAIIFVVLLAGTLVVFVSAIPPATALFNSVKSN
ncbi:MAG: hypothetical protein HC765_06155 [Brachymonas sp.]|nr:hypothetical protein [Brachymonas sp.]